MAAAFDPIKEILRNMNKSETIEVNFIDFDIDDEFEFKQSDFDESKNKKDRLVEESMDRIDEILSDFDEYKSPKDRCVESAMGSIDEILSGKHFRAIRDSIEMQIRQAYKQGYCDGIDDAPGVDDARKEGFRDGVTYCKQKIWQISPDEGLEKQKMEDSI